MSRRVVRGAKESQSGKDPRFVFEEFNLQFQLISGVNVCMSSWEICRRTSDTLITFTHFPEFPACVNIKAAFTSFQLKVWDFLAVLSSGHVLVFAA